MSRVYLPLIILLLIVFQGVTVDLIPTILIDADWVIVSHAVFLFLILIKLFYDLENTYNFLVFGILAGIIIDIVYTDILGVYMFSYAIMLYFVHGMRKFFHANFYTSILLVFISVGLIDYMLYLIYHFVGVTQMPLTVYLTNRLLPTIGVNMLLFIIFYLIFKKKLVEWSHERFNQQ